MTGTPLRPHAMTQRQHEVKERERIILALLDTWTTLTELETLSGYTPHRVLATVKALLAEGAVERNTYKYRRVDRQVAGRRFLGRRKTHDAH